MTPRRRLTNLERAELRRACTSHAAWPDYRRANGLDSSRCFTSGDATLAIAAALGVDIDAVLHAASQGASAARGYQPPSPRPAAPDTSVASRVFAPKPLPRPVAPSGATPSADDMTALKRFVERKVAPVESRMADLETAFLDLKAPEPRVIVMRDKVAIADLPAMRHPMLETVMRACMARDVNGFHVNVWLSGPAGSGKSHAAKTIAETAKLAFGFHGAMSMSHELLGFVDAGGKYHTTQFVERFSNGGVILLDELDSWASDATLALNAALANGMASLPDGRIVARHPDCVVIGAANTWGNGATADYVGRNKLDAAFLSRFPVKLAWGYDEELERHISGDAEFAARVQRARAFCAEKGVKHMIDPRQSIAGAALIAAGFSADEAARMTYLAGLSSDQARLIDNAAR